MFAFHSVHEGMEQINKQTTL